jgi:hypothetical protein
VTRLALAVAVVAVLVTAPVATGHGGGSPNYRSVVTSVRPSAPGVTISVIDRDDRLRLVSTSQSEIVILGYDGEPYLRFTPDGAFRNTRSPATYLNEDRLGDVDVPATADADAEPDWEQVAAHPTFEWHDHRIHWMSPIDPPQVRDDPSVPHHVFDWTVQGTVDGRPFTISGRLGYEPPSSSPPWLFLALPLAALLVAGGAFRYARKRKTASAMKRSRGAI